MPDDSCAADFLTMIREHFVVEEGEGKPVKFLLGIAVHQDLAAGTISLDMSMAIDKLAKGILTPEELVKSKGIHYPMLLSPLPRLSVREVPQSQFDFYRFWALYCTSLIAFALILLLLSTFWLVMQLLLEFNMFKLSSVFSCICIT